MNASSVIQLMGTTAECIDHTIGDLVEQRAQGSPQQGIGKLVFQVQNDSATGTAVQGDELPAALQTLEWPVDQPDVDARVPGHDVAGGEGLADRTPADLQTGFDSVLAGRAHARPAAPGEKAGIFLDVRHQREHLAGRVGNERTSADCLKHLGTEAVEW